MRVYYYYFKNYRVLDQIQVYWIKCKALDSLGPTYLWECLSLYEPHMALHSATQHHLVVPGSKDVHLVE